MAVHNVGHDDVRLAAKPVLRQARWRRFGVWTAVLLAAVIHTAQSVMAQDWPTRPVSMVVPFAAGSASDTMARAPPALRGPGPAGHRECHMPAA